MQGASTSLNQPFGTCSFRTLLHRAVGGNLSSLCWGLHLHRETFRKRLKSKLPEEPPALWMHSCSECYAKKKIKKLNLFCFSKSAGAALQRSPCKAANIDVGINNSPERSLEPTCPSRAQAQPHSTQPSHGTPRAPQNSLAAT